MIYHVCSPVGFTFVAWKSRRKFQQGVFLKASKFDQKKYLKSETCPTNSDIFSGHAQALGSWSRLSSMQKLKQKRFSYSFQ